ncbi:MAG: sulfatase-like hydrolase/transferase [Oscillospiraceae bacterium]|nr:sulfatase-like hydrolase/transferase [Oscillospiraceae bacterium]
MAKKIVIIMTDTQRTDMVSCYSRRDGKNAGVKTPHIDSIATDGIRFNKAYTTQPVCGPARSAIFTGLFPHSNGVCTNSVSLYDNVKTVGQRMSDNGFHTAYIGKWHLDGGDYFGTGKCPDGWDKNYWYDMRCYLEELSDEDRLRSRQQDSMRKDGGISEDFTYGHRCSEKAIDFLKTKGEEDFLLVVSYDEPHGPCLCPEPYASMYNSHEFPLSPNIYDSLENKPDYQKVWAGNALYEDRSKAKIRGGYFFGCNTFVDYEIGRIYDAIKKYADDALVIYTSDHGDFLGSHRLNNKGPAAYDEIAHIPLIMQCKGLIEPGKIYDAPVSHIDIVPTVLDFAGIPVPKILQGKSLIPAFKNTEHTIRVNEYVFIEFERYEIDHDGFGGWQPMRAVYDGRYKLSVNIMSSDELYDLENDPYEICNLISEESLKEVRNHLHDILLEWQNSTRDPLRGYYWETRPWRTDARKPTWEYTGMTRQRENEEYEPRQLDYDTGLAMTEAVRQK